MRVEYSDPALGDLLAITDRVALDSPGAADRLKDRIFEATERLGDQPRLGRPGRIARTRELILRPFIVPYHVRGQIVEILAVIDGRRGDIAAVIEDRLNVPGESGH